MAAYLIVAAGVACFTAARYKDGLPIILLTAAVVHCSQWLIFSGLWPRHLWPGFMLMIFGACSPLLLRQRKACAFVTAFFLLFARPDVLDRVLRSQLADTDGRYAIERQATLDVTTQ